MKGEQKSQKTARDSYQFKQKKKKLICCISLRVANFRELYHQHIVQGTFEICTGRRVIVY